MQVLTQPHRPLRETVPQLGVVHAQPFEVFGHGDQEFPQPKIVSIRALEEGQLAVVGGREPATSGSRGDHLLDSETPVELV